MVNHPNRSTTTRQLEALAAAVEKGGAAYLRGRRMGGALRRMIDRMVNAGLLEDCPPWPATDAGRARYAEMKREG